jgi:hypothetical protein
LVSLDPCAYILQSEIGNIEIFPNPTTDLWNLSSDGYELDEIELFDCMGKRVFESILRSTHTAIPSQGLTPGVYFLKLHINGRELNRRLIKN